jgi:hypothetical protein
MTDKVEILGSPLGMYALPKETYINTVMRDDGSLDEVKLNEMVACIANMGANALRDFYWMDTQEGYEKLSPLWHEGNLSFRFNDRFFIHQKKIAETCNRYNLRYYFCLFEHCGTKKEVGQWNPWRFFSDFFYGSDAANYRHQFIDRMIDALAGFDAGVELCNEPDSGKGEFLADTFIYLARKGFDAEKIILGIDYHLKEKSREYGQDYRDMRNKIVTELGKDWEQGLKSTCISPVHNATLEQIEELWGPEVGPGGTRRILYSMDGVRKPGRPDRNMMHRIAAKVLKTKTEAREKGKVLFEVVYGKQNTDPLDSIEGVSEAYKEIWGQYPENYGKFKDVGPIPPTPPPPPGTPSYKTHVTHGYRGLLGREPDPTGLRDYVAFLEGGGAVLEFCRKLLNSDEFRNNSANLPLQDLAARLYRGILGREPDMGGLKDTMGDIRNGRTAERAAAMIESEEFKTRFG